MDKKVLRHHDGSDVEVVVMQKHIYRLSKA
jgi:hypothetical protein